MRFIPTKIHGVIDYVVGGTLIAAPRFLGFADGSPKHRVPEATGMAVIAYSAFTNYERGMVKSIPVTTHLCLDMLGGAVLASSPWVFGFARHIKWPHVVIGLMSMVVPRFTQTTPAYDA